MCHNSGESSVRAQGDGNSAMPRTGSPENGPTNGEECARDERGHRGAIAASVRRPRTRKGRGACARPAPRAALPRPRRLS